MSQFSQNFYMSPKIKSTTISYILCKQIICTNGFTSHTHSTIYKVNKNFNLADFKLYCRTSNCKISNIKNKVTLHTFNICCVFCRSNIFYLNLRTTAVNLKKKLALKSQSLPIRRFFYSGTYYHKIGASAPYLKIIK